MKTVLERWQLTGAGPQVTSTSRGAFQAQAGAELQLGSAQSELEAIRRQLGILRPVPQPASRTTARS